MREGSPRIVSIRLKVARIGLGADGRMDLRCMGCGSGLEVHQPDQEYPDRILGTCERCHSWVVADFASEKDDGVMIFLPGGNLADCLGIVT